jgi:RND family efflux transporter MFP subunit
VDELVLLTGVLAAPPGRDVKLGALIPGRLAKLLVAEGDPVKAGQELAEIEGGPVTDELLQAEATANEAKAAADAAEVRRSRAEALLNKGVAAAQEVEQARVDAVATRSAWKRAQAAVSLARRRLSRSVLVAPFEGLVVAVFVRAGEPVDGNGQPVLQVAAPDPIEARCAVVPRDAARLRVGMQATVSVESLGLKRSGEVFAIAPAADPASGNVLVRTRLRNEDGKLKLGVLARILVAAGHLDAGIAVPDSALVPGPDGGLQVLVIQDGEAKGREVQVSFENDGRAVLSGGLDGGEEVVVEGGYALPEGSKVEVVR